MIGRKNQPMKIYLFIPYHEQTKSLGLFILFSFVKRRIKLRLFFRIWDEISSQKEKQNLHSSFNALMS